MSRCSPWLLLLTPPLLMPQLESVHVWFAASSPEYWKQTWTLPPSGTTARRNHHRREHHRCNHQSRSPVAILALDRSQINASDPFPIKVINHFTSHSLGFTRVDPGCCHPRPHYQARLESDETGSQVRPFDCDLNRNDPNLIRSAHKRCPHCTRAVSELKSA